MPIWSYVAQQVLGETLTADVRVTAVSPQAEVSGRPSMNFLRSFRLRYTAVTTAEAASMAAFFAAQQGAFQAFTLISPNDQRSYQVRFDTALRPAHFQANLLQSGGELVFVVVTS